jgi:hypothetical protein
MRRPTHRRLIPTLFALEARNLLSTAALDFPPPVQYVNTSFGNAAIITGTKHNDDIIVTGDPFNGGLTVDYNGSLIPLQPGTRFLVIDGKDGDDTITLNTKNTEVTAHGGEGNDTFVVDPNNSDPLTLRGDAGTDTLVGGNDFSTFFVEEPDSFEPVDVDVVAQGKLLWIYTRNDPTSPTGSEANTVTVNNNEIVVDDITSILYDPSFTNTLLISTNDGNDLIVNQSDATVIAQAGDGKDTLIGHEGDSLYGEQGNDVISTT